MNKDSFNIVKKSLEDTEYLMTSLNIKNPKRELSLAITKIQEAMMWFNKLNDEE